MTFEEACQDPTVCRWVGEWERSQSIPEVAMLKLCIVELVREKQELAEKSIALSLLAPKRYRLPDGTFHVMHVPDELIPVTGEP